MEGVRARVLDAGAVRDVDSPERVAEALGLGRSAAPRVDKIQAPIGAALACALGRPRARGRALVRALVAARVILHAGAVLASLPGATLRGVRAKLEAPWRDLDAGAGLLTTHTNQFTV